MVHRLAAAVAALSFGGGVTFAAGALGVQASDGDSRYLWAAAAVALIVGFVTSGVWVASRPAGDTGSPQQSARHIAGGVMQAGRDVNVTVAAATKPMVVGPTHREVVDELRRFAAQYRLIADLSFQGQADRVTSLMEIERVDRMVVEYINAWEIVAEALGPSAASRLLTERASEKRQLLFHNGDPEAIWRALARTLRVREFVGEAEHYFHLPTG